MTSEEFESFCRDICPQCKAGVVVRQREDTREFVHDIVSERGPMKSWSHVFCLASHFRIKHKDSLS